MATKKPQPAYLTQPQPDIDLDAGEAFLQSLEAPALRQVEQPRTVMGTLGDVGLSLVKGAVAVPEAAIGLADLATGGRAGQAAEAIGLRAREAREVLDSGYSDAQKRAFGKVQQAQGFIDTALEALKNPSVIGHSVLESLPLMGAGGVVGRGAVALAPRAAPAAGALGEGVVSAGSAAEQVRQQTADGRLSGEQAALAGASGVATGLFGYGGAKFANSSLGQRLGIADVDTWLAGAQKNPVIAAGLTRRVLGGAISEGLIEELPQSVSEQVLQNLALGKPLDEGVDKAAVLGLLSGSVMGGAFNALSGGGAPAPAPGAPAAVPPQPSAAGAPAAAAPVAPLPADARPSPQAPAGARDPLADKAMANIEQLANRDFAAIAGGRIATGKALAEAAKARRAAEYDNVEALKKAGEIDAAATLKASLDKQVAAEIADPELQLLGAAGQVYAGPDFQTLYRTKRGEGTSPADAAGHAATLSGFLQLARHVGMSDKAIARTYEKARDLDMGELPQFLENAMGRLADRGFGKPMRDVSKALEQHRDAAIQAATNALLKEPEAAEAPVASPAVPKQNLADTNSAAAAVPQGIEEPSGVPRQLPAPPSERQPQATPPTGGTPQPASFSAAFRSPDGEVHFDSNGTLHATVLPKIAKKGYSRADLESGWNVDFGDEGSIFLPKDIAESAPSKQAFIDDAYARLRSGAAVPYKGGSEATKAPTPVEPTSVSSKTKEPLGEIQARQVAQEAAPTVEAAAQAAPDDQGAAGSSEGAGADVRGGAAGAVPGGQPAAVAAGTLEGKTPKGGIAFGSQPRSDGTLKIEGDPAAIKQQLTDAGVPESAVKPAKGGVVVGKTQVEKAKKAVSKVGPAMADAMRSVGLDPDAPPDKAKELRRQADALTKESGQMLERIPAGQPVVSTADRNLRERAMEKGRKAAELQAEADALEKKPAPTTPASDADMQRTISDMLQEAGTKGFWFGVLHRKSDGEAFDVKVIPWPSPTRGDWGYEFWSEGKKGDGIPFPALKSTTTLQELQDILLGYMNADENGAFSMDQIGVKHAALVQQRAGAAQRQEDAKQEAGAAEVRAMRKARGDEQERPWDDTDLADYRRMKRLQDQRFKTASDEKLIGLLEQRIKGRPDKWKVGDGVSYKVTAGGVGMQTNRGFRIIAIDPETKTATVRSVADTGLTSSGGNNDRIGDAVLAIGELVRDRKYDAPAADPEKVPEVAPPAEAAKPGKPRMGETAEALWEAIKKDSAGIVHEGRIIVPTLRVVAGDDFKLNAGGKLEVVDKKAGGMAVRDATDAEADEFHRDLSADRVQVLLLSAPGYGSGYGQQKVLRELHSPSGNGFKKDAAPTAATHKDPGEPAEPATAPVVAQAIAKAAKAEGRTRAEMRADLLAQIDAAVKNTPNYADYLAVVAKDGKERADDLFTNNNGHRNFGAEVAKGKERITFDVEGDGTFSVVNSFAGLMAFRAKVEGNNSGFQDKLPGRKPLPASTSVKKGSPNQTAAVESMLEEGDLQAALDYMEAVGMDRASLGKQALARIEQLERLGDKAQETLYTRIDPKWDYGRERANRSGTLTRQNGDDKFEATVIGYRDAMDRPDDFKTATYVITKNGKKVGEGSSSQFQFALVAAQQELDKLAPEQPAAPDEPVAPAVQPEPAKPATIADTGEKIGGARKDKWKERGLAVSDLDTMSDTEGAELAVKQNVWKPDFEKMVADGATARAAASVKIVYDRLAARPKADTPAGRRQYVQMMQHVRDVYGAVKTEADFKAAKGNLLYDKLKWTQGSMGPDTGSNERAKANAQGIEDLGEHMKQAKAMLFSVYKGRSDPFYFDFQDDRKAAAMERDGFPAKGEPWKTRLVIGTRGGPGTTDAGLRIYVEQAAKLGTPVTPEQVKAGVFTVTKKTGNEVLAILPTKADAEAAAKNLYEYTMKGGKDDKPEPERPHLDELKREGLPQRIDRDVTAKDFMEHFGFRGIEFGNWSAQDERQRILNMAYDGLADLAEIMGVPPKAMSLNGTLGMAFGARGGGRFAAHYEPGKLVINMTKLRGGGSMAHEWAHALDHYFGELEQPDAYKGRARGASGWYEQAAYTGRPMDRMEKDASGKWVSVTKMRLSNLRPEMAQAFDRLMSALFSGHITKAEMIREIEGGIERTQAMADAMDDPKLKKVYLDSVANQKQNLEETRAEPDDTVYARGKSEYAKEAAKLSGKSESGYWSRPTEMFARAFESWIFDRVVSMGARSDYLVHGVEETRFAGGGYKGNPYPVGKERAAINAAFDNLAKTIETKPTDKGVAMFSRSQQRAPGLTRESFRSAMAEAFGEKVADALEARGVVVPLADQTELPAHVVPFLRSGNIVYGFYDPKTNRTYAVLENLDVGMVKGLALHEIGVHYGFKAMLGDEKYRQVLRQVDLMHASGNAKVRAARAEAKANAARESQVAEETLAYLVQSAPELGPIRSLIAAIKAWLFREFSIGGKYLTEADIAALAKAAVEHSARGEPAKVRAAPAFALTRDVQWYSELSRRIASAPMNAGPASAWDGLLTNLTKTGVKPDEIEWSGVREWLAQQSGKVTKEAVLAFLDANGVQVQEVVIGAPDYSDVEAWWSDEGGANEETPFNELSDREKADAAARYADEVGQYDDGDRKTPKYGQYQLPGGENYREVLLTLPVKTGQAWVSKATGRFNSWITPGGRMDPAVMGHEAKRAMELSGLEVREITLTDSDKNYRSSHWDEPNILAHIRLNDRTDAEGKRVLFVEEIQSDWAQEGRRHGFTGDPIPQDTAWGDADTLDEFDAREEAQAWADRNPPPDPGENTEARLVVRERPRFGTGAGQPSRWVVIEQQRSTVATAPNKGGVPKAPFVGKTDAWLTLALKRIVHMAATEGYDRVAFVSGQQSADRYDLSKQISKVVWDDASARGIGDADLKAPEGYGTLRAYDLDGREVIDRSMEYTDLPDAIGKDVAAKLLQSKPMKARGRSGWMQRQRELSGLDLKVGGEGMIAFYDKIVPAAVNRLLAKLGGGKLGMVQFEAEPTGREDPDSTPISDDGLIEYTQPGFDITPAMREKVGGGLPLFSRAMEPTAIAAAARNTFNDLTSTSNTFNRWWHRTVGTQYHKAQKDRDFRRVFDAAQAYLLDVSRFANESADLARDLLPKLEHMRDVFKDVPGIDKNRTSAADVKAAAQPVFEGTIGWVRNENGRATRLKDAQAEAEQMSVHDKAHAMLKAGKLAPNVLKMWQGMPLEHFESAVETRYAEQMLKPGVVFTAKELKEHFGLNDKQAGLYRQARAAIDKSLDDLGTSTIAKLLKVAEVDSVEIREAIAAGDHQRLARLLDEFVEFDPTLQELANQVAATSLRVEALKREGYAPLKRFGQFAVSLRDPEGDELLEFYLFESEREANAKLRQLSGKGAVSKSVMSQQDYKLLQGINPESLELFGDILEQAGVLEPGDAVFQTYLREAVAQRSALKRFIHREGYPGFSMDLRRVLADFVTSNARLASKNHHFGEMLEAANEVPKSKGDVRDEAVNLVKYVQEPTEEAAKIRGLLFVQYIGGSVASAIVNMTQTLTMTYPYLSQFTNPGKAMATVTGALKTALGKPRGELAEALTRAEQSGVVSPQEIHHLNAEAGRMFSAHPAVQRAMFLWGSFFSLAEQFNRRVAFIAAWDTAKAQGNADPYAFAVKAVEETQGVYNRGNRPNWARGAVGATLFTFKQFSISYLEFLARLPNRERAVALAVLLLAAGAEGMPFSDDLDDIIDTIAQRMGYALNSKEAKRKFLVETLGMPEAGAEFVLKGASAIPGAPIDISARMGMANLLPGTGMLRKDVKDHSRDVLEIAGPAGGVFKDALALAEGGDYLETMAPVALRNLAKAADMFASGQYRDTKGRRVVDIDATDALWKAVGFQPSHVAKESLRARVVSQNIGLARQVETEIADEWARGRVDGDEQAVQQAKERLAEWNATNPASRIVIKPRQIILRMRELKRTREERIVKRAPTELRSTIAAQLQ